VTEIDLSEPGEWLGVAMVDVASQRAAGQGSVKVSRRVPAPVGARARSGPSPMTTSSRAIARSCTREWVFVIDRKGIIRARLGEGPACASEIEDALRPLL